MQPSASQFFGLNILPKELQRASIAEEIRTLYQDELKEIFEKNECEDFYGNRNSAWMANFITDRNDPTLSMSRAFQLKQIIIFAKLQDQKITYDEIDSNINLDDNGKLLVETENYLNEKGITLSENLDERITKIAEHAIEHDKQKPALINMKMISKDPVFSYETTSKCRRIFYNIISVIIFPIGLCRLIHRIAGLIVVPSAVMNYEKEQKNLEKILINREDYVSKKISIEVNGKLVDAFVYGRHGTIDNGRWIVNSNPNCTVYEQLLLYPDVFGVHQNMRELDANYIFFNYPGTALSKGMVSRSATRASHQAVMRMFEEKVGANTIITVSASLGGGVSNEAFKDYKLADGVTYVKAPVQTFSKISKIVPLLPTLVGWNLSSISSNKEIPEVVLQTGAEQLNAPQDVQDDFNQDENYNRIPLITAESSLAKHYLKHPEDKPEKVAMFGLPDQPHMAEFSYRENSAILTSRNKKIREFLGEN
ncbi:MAG: hypothetical protein H7A37_05380 [Chlamydiales bacterium]|nr:hypothetical protein [Chlamydiales bacterium]